MSVFELMVILFSFGTFLVAFLTLIIKLINKK